MLPGEMADGGVETREQRRRRRIGLGLDPDGESDEDPVDPGHGGPGDGDGDEGHPGGGDGGNPDGGGGPGGPGESDSGEESDPGDDETARAIKRQSKSLLILAKSIKDLVSKKEDGEYYVDATTGVKKVKKRISPPIFKGDKGERPEAHLLRAKDWFDSSGIIRNQDKVYNFKHTLDSKAREWYADLINKAHIPPRWSELETAFSRYFSTQGRSIKHLHDSWRKMSFNPETDDIEDFVRDAQECAKQLEYDDHVIINMIKSVMPREIYGTLYYMDDLAEVINFCKDYF